MSMLTVSTRLVHSRVLAKMDSLEMELYATMTMNVLTRPTTTVTPMPNAQTILDHIHAPVISGSAETEQRAKITTSAAIAMAC